MDKPEDEKYWSSSVTKGFDFDSEEVEHSGEIFGATPWQTAQLSKQVQQNIPQPISPTHTQLSVSLSSLSTSSNSSLNFIGRKPSKQYEVTCSLLSSTINDETISSPKDVVRSIFLGMSFDLSCFKKLKDKTILLDEALKLGDSDAICAVLLFLQNTLHQLVLFSLLKQRRVAAREYIVILEKQKRFKEAAMLCDELQSSKEAAVHLYNSCFTEEKQNLHIFLEQIMKNEFKNLKQTENELEVVKEHIQLLERQYPIAFSSPVSRSRPEDPERENDGTSPFVGKPISTDNLVGSSLLSTLQYCCRYYWDASENLLVSPIGLKKTFRLTERQYVWNAFIGRILMKEDPIKILLVKGMFGAPKISANLSISRILEIASHLNGKPNLFDQLLPLTETSDKRYQLAKRYKRHRIVIDVLISNRDRISLLQYKDSIDDQTEIDYINNTLRVSSTRWKN